MSKFDTIEHITTEYETKNATVQVGSVRIVMEDGDFKTFAIDGKEDWGISAFTLSWTADSRAVMRLTTERVLIK